MKKVITQSEKMQLLGLLTLARERAKIINLAEKSIASILESEYDYLDWFSDAIWDDSISFEDVLKRMKINVSEELIINDSEGE